MEVICISKYHCNMLCLCVTDMTDYLIGSDEGAEHGWTRSLQGALNHQSTAMTS